MSYAAVQLLLENDHQILPLSEFMDMFTEKFNETLNERLIKAMKHAIQVSFQIYLNCLTHLFNDSNRFVGFYSGSMSK